MTDRTEFELRLAEVDAGFDKVLTQLEAIGGDVTPENIQAKSAAYIEFRQQNPSPEETDNWLNTHTSGQIEQRLIQIAALRHQVEINIELAKERGLDELVGEHEHQLGFLENLNTQSEALGNFMRSSVELLQIWKEEH